MAVPRTNFTSLRDTIVEQYNKILKIIDAYRMENFVDVVIKNKSYRLDDILDICCCLYNMYPAKVTDAIKGKDPLTLLEPSQFKVITAEDVKIKHERIEQILNDMKVGLFNQKAPEGHSSLRNSIRPHLAILKTLEQQLKKQELEQKNQQEIEQKKESEKKSQNAMRKQKNAKQENDVVLNSWEDKIKFLDLCKKRIAVLSKIICDKNIDLQTPHKSLTRYRRLARRDLHPFGQEKLELEVFETLYNHVAEKLEDMNPLDLSKVFSYIKFSVNSYFDHQGINVSVDNTNSVDTVMVNSDEDFLQTYGFFHVKPMDSVDAYLFANHIKSDLNLVLLVKYHPDRSNEILTHVLEDQDAFKHSFRGASDLIKIKANLPNFLGPLFDVILTDKKKFNWVLTLGDVSRICTIYKEFPEYQARLYKFIADNPDLFDSFYSMDDVTRFLEVIPEFSKTIAKYVLITKPELLKRFYPDQIVDKNLIEWRGDESKLHRIYKDYYKELKTLLQKALSDVDQALKIYGDSKNDDEHKQNQNLDKLNGHINNAICILEKLHIIAHHFPMWSKEIADLSEKPQRDLFSVAYNSHFPFSYTNPTSKEVRVAFYNTLSCLFTNPSVFRLNTSDELFQHQFDLILVSAAGLKGHTKLNDRQRLNLLVYALLRSQKDAQLATAATPSDLTNHGLFSDTGESKKQSAIDIINTVTDLTDINDCENILTIWEQFKECTNLPELLPGLDNNKLIEIINKQIDLISQQPQPSLQPGLE